VGLIAAFLAFIDKYLSKKRFFLKNCVYCGPRTPVCAPFVVLPSFPKPDSKIL